MPAAAALILREGDRGRLEALARSASARPALAQRARIVLMSAEGLTNTEIADGGRPPPHLGASQWSSRLLGQHLGISFATVSRIWRKWGIQPEHVETFAFGSDLQ